MQTLLPRILADIPSGASVQSLVHYAQEIESGRFQKYDYGARGNLKNYNQTTPPDYELSKIKVPMGLFWAENDWLSNSLVNYTQINNFFIFLSSWNNIFINFCFQDVRTLSKSLPTMILNYKVNYSKFNHLDYLWGIDAPKLVYEKLISEMEKYT